MSQKQTDKVQDAVRKEKEQLQQEFNKVMLTKSKLESLCRELQKQNKCIKDESFSKIKEEEERRKETQAKFQKSLNEIQSLMNDNNEKNLKLKQDNQEMTDKFKYILEQYELREQQIDKINKQMELVQQLSDAKVAKIEMESQMVREQILTEKNTVETELLVCKKEVLELRQTEKYLREQVEIYSSKYNEFQDSLKKSHNIFTGYKTDMEKMSKKIMKLEKETAAWRSKAEKANSIAIDLASEKQIRDEHIAKVTKQIWQLQKLCRTLQAERTVLIAALKENNIEIPPMPEVPAEKEPEVAALAPSQGPDKLELMTRSCAELKQNLAALQGQLKDIEQSGPPTTATAAPENAKKNKKAKKKKNAQEAAKAGSPDAPESTKSGSPDIVDDAPVVALSQDASSSQAQAIDSQPNEDAAAQLNGQTSDNKQPKLEAGADLTTRTDSNTDSNSIETATNAQVDSPKKEVQVQVEKEDVNSDSKRPESDSNSKVPDEVAKSSPEEDSVEQATSTAAAAAAVVTSKPEAVVTA